MFSQASCCLTAGLIDLWGHVRLIWCVKKAVPINSGNMYSSGLIIKYKYLVMLFFLCSQRGSEFPVNLISEVRPVCLLNRIVAANLYICTILLLIKCIHSKLTNIANYAFRLTIGQFNWLPDDNASPFLLFQHPVNICVQFFTSELLLPGEFHIP